MGVDPRYRPARLGLRKRKGFSAPVREVTGPEQTAISAGVRPGRMKSSVSSSATVAWNLCLTWEQFEFAVDVSDACDIRMSAIRVYESVFSSGKITASGFGEIRVRPRISPQNSEQQLQRELDLPRGGGCVCNLAGRLAVTIVSAVAQEDHLIRESEIHVIQNIERFRAELQRHALPDGDPLKQGRVEVEQARAAEGTAPRVPEGAGKRHRESTGIKPVVHAP